MKTPKVYISEVKACVEEVTVDDLMIALTQPDVILIDVRENEEYQHCLLYTSPSPRDS